MSTQSSLQDCYFYFYSSCTKGDECPFRHCELALGTETVCSLWREGRCFRSNCKFRHMESRINRGTIACYWENQPGGCLKPHCAFMHRKLRNGVQVVKVAPGLILPTSDGKSSPKHADSSEVSHLPNKVLPSEKATEVDVAPDSSLAPVTPLVLSFDEGEESDTESVTSTPVKQGDKKAASARLSVKASGAAEEKDFGIKTLEQIRMEKIHKESDSYYGAAYASTPLNAPQLLEQHYPPKAEFLTLPKDSSLDKSSPAPIVEPKLSGVDEETDLRGRLLSRRNGPLNKVNQSKRLVNFKKQNGSQVEGNQAKRLISFTKQNGSQVEVISKKLDFRIKTLEEIRKEKENKQSKSEVAINNSSGVSSSLEEKKPPNNTKPKTFRKIKLNRKPKESYSVPSDLKQDVGALNRTDMIATRLVSNGLKKISPGSSEESIEVPMLSKSSSDSSPGKRKSDDDSCPTASKFSKIVTNSNCDIEEVDRINSCPDRNGKSHAQLSPQRPETSPSSANETSNSSSDIRTSSSPSLAHDEVAAPQSSVPNKEMNSVVTATPTSPDERLENECISKADKKLNSLESEFSTPAESDTNGAERDSSIDRSMSVDAELDELLGDDDLCIDEMDATPSDDILQEIEDFLES